MKRALAVIVLAFVTGGLYGLLELRIERLEADLELLRAGCGQRSAGLRQELNIWKSAPRFSKPGVR